MQPTFDQVIRSIERPDLPIHVLFDRSTPRVQGWPDAELHARKAGDRVINAAMRVATPFVETVLTTQKALKLPGWKKAAAVPAPIVGFVGGVFLGAGGFCFDAAHVVLHLGGSVGNAAYAVAHGTAPAPAPEEIPLEAQGSAEALGDGETRAEG